MLDHIQFVVVFVFFFLNNKGTLKQFFYKWVLLILIEFCVQKGCTFITTIYIDSFKVKYRGTQRFAETYQMCMKLSLPRNGRFLPTGVAVIN